MSDDAVPQVQVKFWVIDRIKLALRERREQRTVLVSNPNKVVAEVEIYARMTSVKEEDRIIDSSRH